MNVAVDAGHGYTKGLSVGGQRILFPSLIAPLPPFVDLADFGHSDIITIDDAPYLVGDAARTHATPLWSRDKAADTDTLRLILVAAAKLGSVGPIQLATGLPLSWFGSQRRSFRKALTGFGSVVQLPNHAPQRLWFESVRVLPQGVAAAAPVLSGADFEAGDYLVVDIGYRTTDYIVVTKAEDGSLDYEPSAAGSLEIGMHTVTQTIAQAITDQYQVSYSASEVESRPFVVVRGQKIDVTQRFHEARQVTAKRLAQELAAALGPQVDKLMGIVAVGGGSDILAAAIPGIIVPEEPQWANVVGYLMALG